MQQRHYRKNFEATTAHLCKICPKSIKKANSLKKTLTIPTSHKRFPLLVGLITASLLVGCGRSEMTATRLERTLERTELYNELTLLETSSIGDQSLAVASNNNGMVISSPLSPAEFELARNRRNLAFERLSALPAPDEDDADFSSFWEIHQAYRFAVSIGRFGRGRVGLVQTRPYPGDHLNNPLLDVPTITDFGSDEVVDSLPSQTPPPPRVWRHPDSVRQDIENLTSRLQLAIPTHDVFSPMIAEKMRAQLLETPFGSEAVFREMLANAPKASSFDFTPADFLSEDMFKAVQALDSVLTEIEIADNAVETTHAPEFYNALIMQSTGGQHTPTSCQEQAERLRADVETRLNAMLAGVEATFLSTDENDTIDPQLQAILVEPNRTMPERFKTLLAAMIDLETFKPEEPVVDPLLERESDTEPRPDTIPKSLYFEGFTQTLKAIETDWKVLSAIPLQELTWQETGYEETAIPPSVGTEFSLNPITFDDQTTPIGVNFNDLQNEALPIVVMDVLLQYYPGQKFERELMVQREDLPALSRNLSNAAFSEGWPYFALEQMSMRNAFRDAPLLEIARLYRLLQIAIEAETEAVLWIGEDDREILATRLVTELGTTQEDALETLSKLEVEPGKACAALTGYSKFGSLYQRARGVLGNRFNVRDFNRTLLRSGSRPLKLVEMDIDTWLSEQISDDE